MFIRSLVGGSVMIPDLGLTLDSCRVIDLGFMFIPERLTRSRDLKIAMTRGLVQEVSPPALEVFYEPSFPAYVHAAVLLPSRVVTPDRYPKLDLQTRICLVRLGNIRFLDQIADMEVSPLVQEEIERRRECLLLEKF